MRRGIIAASAAALVAAIWAGVPAVMAAVPGPAYLAVTSFSAVAQNAETATLFVTTMGDIPRRADSFINANPAVGLAWADLDNGKVFVAVIHPVLGRDSLQNPNGWHVHTATVTGGATAPHDFCVASIDSTPTAGISIDGNTMQVNVRLSSLPVSPGAFNAAAGFTLQPDSACASGLAVQLST